MVAVARTATGDASDRETDACTNCGGELHDLACDSEASNELPAREDTRTSDKGVLRAFEAAADGLEEALANRQLADCTEASAASNVAAEGAFGVSAKWLPACNCSGPEVMNVGEPEVSAWKEAYARARRCLSIEQWLETER